MEALEITMISELRKRQEFGVRVVFLAFVIIAVAEMLQSIGGRVLLVGLILLGILYRVLIQRADIRRKRDAVSDDQDKNI